MITGLGACLQVVGRWPGRGRALSWGCTPLRGSKGRLRRGLGSEQPQTDTWSGAQGPWSRPLGHVCVRMYVACAAWALTQKDPGLGNYQHNLPRRDLGMKYQKELRLRS